MTGFGLVDQTATAVLAGAGAFVLLEVCIRWFLAAVKISADGGVSDD